MQIRILICYVLSKFDKPIGADDLKNTLHYEGLANYFEVASATSELERVGNIKSVEYRDRICYVATDTGKNIAKELEKDVPFSVREYSVKAIERVLQRQRNERENKVLIEELDYGCMVTCISTDGKREIMRTSLLVPDKVCAEIIRERFLDNPSRVYMGISEILTGK